MNPSNPSESVRSVLIVGGGTAGWMAAAALSKVNPSEHLEITLVESEAIGTVGVGEATIPEIRTFNRVLGIEEKDFLAATSGTFKLGIEFVNWGEIGERYIHPFGLIGTDIDNIQFYHFWQKFFQKGTVGGIEDYSICVQAAYANKFIHPRHDLANSPLNHLSYAYHFDSSLYGKFLRKFAEERGVKRIENKIVDVDVSPKDGFITGVRLEDGQTLSADLYIDCSGFRGLLIEQALHTGYHNWQDLLPCDRAVTVGTESMSPLPSYTRATAHTAGWQWRIPLQHRTGNGHVYCSHYMSDDEATQTLLDNLEGEPIGEPRQLKFTTGMRKKFWNKNCVAIGLASGFMEPLESTSIHLVYSGISKLIGLFPKKDFSAAVTDKYNQMMFDEFESIKIFLVLHYHLTRRNDSEFWNYCRHLDIPESLSRKLALYQDSGRIYRENEELFSEPSWLTVLHGQGLRANSYHPLVDAHPDELIERFLENIRMVIKKSVNAMPEHARYVEKLTNTLSPEEDFSRLGA